MQKRSVDYVYAGFGPRAAAFLIDSVIVAFICLAIKSPIFIAEIMGGSGAAKVFFDFTLSDIVGYIAGALYFTLLTWKNGRTLGKQLMRLTVVTEEGTRLSFVRTLYRETVGRFLTGLGCIGYIFAAADAEKRGFHDMLSDTRVIYSMGKYERYLSLPIDPRLVKKEEGTAHIKSSHAILDGTPMTFSAEAVSEAHGAPNLHIEHGEERGEKSEDRSSGE